MTMTDVIIIVIAIAIPCGIVGGVAVVIIYRVVVALKKPKLMKENQPHPYEEVALQEQQNEPEAPREELVGYHESQLLLHRIYLCKRVVLVYLFLLT